MWKHSWPYSTCADVIVKQFSSPIMWSKAIDAVHENRIIRMLDNLERNLDEALGELYYSFRTALCSADDIYAKLATMVDDDALAYLQREYGTPEPNVMKAFRDIADNVTAIKEVTGRKLELGEVQYIHEATLRSVLRKEMTEKIVSGMIPFKFMTESQRKLIAEEYRTKAPIEIPEFAIRKPRSKLSGYEQIEYNWRDETYKYVVRWHTRTPGAPPEQGNTWVIERIIPGQGGERSKSQFMIGEDEWVSGHVWHKAIGARKKGQATPEQVEILDKGHWKEK